MAKTLISGTALLCPVSEFIARVDYTAVSMLASDDESPVSPATSPRVLAALRDASGDVEAAALLGERYDADDLALILATDTNARGKIYRIVSDLAWVYLWEGRPNKDSAEPPSLRRTLFYLDQLAAGTRIFGFHETVEAGRMESFVETAKDVEDRRGVVFAADRLFGVRANREFGN